MFPENTSKSSVPGPVFGTESLQMSFDWGFGDEIIPQSQEQRGRLDRRTQRWGQRLE